VFLLAVLGAPAAYRFSSDGELAAPVIKVLHDAEPQFVLLGNSLLETRVDPDYLSTLAGGRRVISLALPSTESAIWYLQLKNAVLASDAPVETVFIFFHKDMITRPLEGLDGQNRGLIAGLLSEDETDYFRVITENRSIHQQMVATLEDVYPFQHQNDSAHDGIAKLSAFLLPSSQQELSDSAEDEFAYHNRRESPAEDPPDDPIRTFEDSVASSFLPLMLDIAREAGVKLVFVRAQERPNQDGSVHESPAMHEYSGALGEYLETAGAGYVDFTGNQAVDRAMYYDSFHIRDRYLPDSTEFFYREMTEYFESEGAAAR
jgi:hypothetical protein